MCLRCEMFSFILALLKELNHGHLPNFFNNKCSQVNSIILFCIFEKSLKIIWCKTILYISKKKKTLRNLIPLRKNVPVMVLWSYTVNLVKYFLNQIQQVIKVQYCTLTHDIIEVFWGIISYNYLLFIILQYLPIYYIILFFLIFIIISIIFYQQSQLKHLVFC